MLNHIDASLLAHANSLLIDYADAVLPSKHYYFTYNLNADPQSYSLVIRPNEKDPFIPAIVAESSTRGVIFHYQDFVTGRPFTREGGPKIKFLSPLFCSYSIFEVSCIHTVLVLYVKEDCVALSFNQDTPVVRITWEA